MPALHPLRPGGRAATHLGRVTARQPLRRVAEAQLGHGPLHGVQRVTSRGGQGRVLAADPLEQPGAQVLQVRTAVEEEHLAGDHRQQLVVVAAEPVAPARQHRADPPDLAVHVITSETRARPGCRQAAEPGIGGEAAEQEGMRGQVRAHGVVRPARGGLAEPVLVLAQEARPIPPRSTPSRTGRSRRTAAAPLWSRPALPDGGARLAVPPALRLHCRAAAAGAGPAAIPGAAGSCRARRRRLPIPSSMMASLLPSEAEATCRNGPGRLAAAKGRGGPHGWATEEEVTGSPLRPRRSSAPGHDGRGCAACPG